jgi:hypothetical protein
MYRKTLSCLHTDSRKSVSDGKLNEAFHAFSKLQLDEKQYPTSTMQIPRTYAEMMARRQKVQEERKAQREARKRDRQSVTK